MTVDNVLHTRKFLYDAAGNIVRKIDRNGRVTEWTFDKLNRHTSETWFENDAQKKQFVTSCTRSGKIASIDDGENKFEFVYDIFGNENKQTQKLADLEKTVEFRTVSDIAGQKTESSLSLDGAADYTNNYTYNTLGKISSIAQQSSSSPSKKVTMGYDVYGQIASQERFQDGKQVAATKNTYDSLGRITSINYSHNDKTLADYHYKWDAANRITEINDDKYGYDKTNQLLSAVYAKKPKEQYAYDLNGNRLTALLQGQEKKYETGNFNRLLSENGEKLEYDAEGNRIAKGDIKYFWDHRNRLVKVVSPSETVEYTYDYQNRLVKRSIGKNAAHFIHDGWQIVRQYENGKPIKRFLWGTKQDELLCDNDNWTLGDHLNTVRDVINTDGKVIAHCDYNAFGKCLSPLKDLSFAYTGKLTDSVTGLQWNINRWYDANAGRWISEDPIGFKGRDENLVRYVKNNSVSVIDFRGYAEYKVGTNDLVITHDAGSGVHGALAPPTQKDFDGYNAWYRNALLAGQFPFYYTDAKAHMLHFLSNLGTTLQIDYNRLISEDVGAKSVAYTDVNAAMAFAETLNKPKSIQITSLKVTNGTCSTKNWFYAVGGFDTWGKGIVSFDEKKCEYSMRLTLAFDDRYNWDPDKSTAIMGFEIADTSLGRLHQVGIAKEFDMKGIKTIVVEWTKGQRFDVATGTLSQPKRK